MGVKYSTFTHFTFDVWIVEIWTLADVEKSPGTDIISCSNVDPAQLYVSCLVSCSTARAPHHCRPWPYVADRRLSPTMNALLFFFSIFALLSYTYVCIFVYKSRKRQGQRRSHLRPFIKKGATAYRLNSPSLILPVNSVFYLWLSELTCISGSFYKFVLCTS